MICYFEQIKYFDCTCKKTQRGVSTGNYKAIQHIIGCGFEIFMVHPALHESNPMHMTGKNTPDI